MSRFSNPSQRRLILVICMLAFGILCLFPQVSLTIAYEDKEQPPYYMGNSSTVLPELPGVAVELVQALTEKVPGISIQLVRVPWSRCVAGLGNNSYDGIFNASYTEARLPLGWYPTLDNTLHGLVDVSRQITTIAYSLYAHRSSGLQWDGSGLPDTGLTVGAPLGYSIVADLRSMGVQVAEVSGTTNLLDMLELNRLQVVALQSVTADALLRDYPQRYRNVVKLEPPVVSKPYYLMLSHGFVSKNPLLARQIWQALKDLREERFEALLEKYRE